MILLQAYAILCNLNGSVGVKVFNFIQVLVLVLNIAARSIFTRLVGMIRLLNRLLVKVFGTACLI